MTAEIAVVNKQAVALAADSAVTLGGGGRNNLKIYNTVNKLFTLSKFHPVGVMVYGNAEMGLLPIETAIKVYRRELGSKAFGTVQEYAQDFLAFLSGSDLLYPHERQSEFVEGLSRDYFIRIRDDLRKKVEKDVAEQGELSDDRILRLIAGVVDEHSGVLTAKMLSSVSAGDVDQIVERHGSAIANARKLVFENLPLTTEQLDKLDLMAASVMVIQNSVVSDTGLVVAGFGESEVCPVVQSFILRGRVGGKLQFRPGNGIDGSKRSGLLPFAQVEMVSMFIEGISPAVKSWLLQSLDQLAKDLPGEAVAASIANGANLSDEQRASILASLSSLLNEARNSVGEKLQQYLRLQQINPVLDTIGALPKHELAEMAEALVNLTSFKQRMSLDAETVGGPIDVAVISKGDGFVWIKRKHYFQPELNHHFLENYFRVGAQ